RIDRDTTGSGTLHLAQTDDTVLNLDGSRRRTIVDLNASGTTRDRTVVTTSANGLSSRTEWDARATGTFNRVQTVAIALGQDGSRTEVVSNLNASDVLRDRTTTTTSGDRNTTVVERDLDGNNHVDQRLTTVRRPDGVVVATALDFNADGTLK